jgi:2-keto-4-pentenoate hydratase
VGAVLASIEIVDDRYRDWPSLGTPTLIADDFFNAGCVLGERIREWRGLDLAAIGGRMLVNGAEVGTGRGADILGHPLEALSWLAGSMADRGRVLKAGEFVTLGSIVATQWVNAGDDVQIEIDGLGSARATFE